MSWNISRGSVTERSKALVVGTSLSRGVGSIPTDATDLGSLSILYLEKIKILFWNIKNNRSWQDSNLRSQREYDFKSDALTARPQLLDHK